MIFLRKNFSGESTIETRFLDYLQEKYLSTLDLTLYLIGNDSPLISFLGITLLIISNLPIVLVVLVGLKLEWKAIKWLFQKN